MKGWSVWPEEPLDRKLQIIKTTMKAKDQGRNEYEPYECDNRTANT